MKIRFVEEYNPLNGETHWYVQKRSFPGWVTIYDTYSYDGGKAKRIWDRVKQGGFERRTKVLDEARV